MVEAAYGMGLTDFGISGHADYSMWGAGIWHVGYDLVGLQAGTGGTQGKSMPGR